MRQGSELCGRMQAPPCLESRLKGLVLGRGLQVEESGVRLERDLPDVVEALENLFLFVDEVGPVLPPSTVPTAAPLPPACGRPPPRF